MTDLGTPTSAAALPEAAVKRPTPKRRKLAQLSGRDRWVLGLMVGVPAFVHIVLVWIPALLTALLSFMKWDNITPVKTADWVGLDNYRQIFTTFGGNLYPALFNNLLLIIWLFVCSAIGIAFAYLLDKNIKGTRVYQSVFYLPVVLSMAIVGYVWQSTMFHKKFGLLNILWPGKPIDFIADRKFLFVLHIGHYDLGLTRNFAALLLAMAWRHIGYIMVIYLAGLKSFDPSLREAAAIDGCSEWQTFRRVVFPGLKPINVVICVITIIEALRAYDIVAALKTPRGTEVMGTLVTGSLTGEGGGRVGIGSAYGMVLFMLCIGFIIWYVSNNFRSRET